jgi:hypothetical protein
MVLQEKNRPQYHQALEPRMERIFASVSLPPRGGHVNVLVPHPLGHDIEKIFLIVNQ